jgi:hypothetical protein
VNTQNVLFLAYPHDSSALINQASREDFLRSGGGIYPDISGCRCSFLFFLSWWHSHSWLCSRSCSGGFQVAILFRLAEAPRSALNDLGVKTHVTQLRRSRKPAQLFCSCCYDVRSYFQLWKHICRNPPLANSNFFSPSDSSSSP